MVSQVSHRGVRSSWSASGIGLSGRRRGVRWWRGRFSGGPSSGAWHRAKAIARIAHQELWDSPADDALFFHATRVRPSWARQKIARATIERHVFYR
jgi:spore germination cell wall hydrolase CwlJ-like protein